MIPGLLRYLLRKHFGVALVATRTFRQVRAERSYTSPMPDEVLEELKNFLCGHPLFLIQSRAMGHQIALSPCTVDALRERYGAEVDLALSCVLLLRGHSVPTRPFAQIDQGTVYLATPGASVPEGELEEIPQFVALDRRYG